MLRLEDINGGFRLLYNNREILSHTEKHPAVAGGQGTGRYKFNYGLFKIKDSKLKMRQPVSWTRVAADEKEIVILFDKDIRLRASVSTEGIIPREHLKLELENSKEGDNRLEVNLSSREGESIYGCGQQYSYLDMKGRKVPIWVMEPGLGRGKDFISLNAELQKGYGGSWYTSYVSQPSYVSTDGRWVHSEATAYTELDFRKGNTQRLVFWEPTVCIRVGCSDSPAALVEGLSAFIGRQPDLPDWVTDGMILGIQGGREETEAKLADALDSGVPVSAIWCQDWEGIRMTSFGKQLFWNWKPAEKLYGDLPAYIRDLEARGVRYLGYINQFLALEGDLYAEAKEKGYCIKNAEGGDYYVTITTFPAAMVDLSNPEATEWLKGIIRKYMIGTGLKGWMADFGEYIPADAVVYSGESAETYHNRYTVEWARINREACLEAGAHDMFVFMRSAYSGSAPHAVSLWNGDQLVNWSRHQGFPTIIPGSLSLGYSGYGNVHSDLGGYTSIAYLKRSKELFMRWAETSCFSPVMRTHEGNRPYKGWLFNSDAESLTHLARFAGIYNALKPYHQALSVEYREKGMPQMRHGWLVNPEDRTLRKLRYQYFYGHDMLIAAVIKKGKTSWKVYIPEGEWVHLWSGKRMESGWNTVEAPIGQPPVFYRKNSEYSDLFASLAAL
ncbi:MAG: alpha-glucosidase [Spirochaetales bacterium]|nr:alpha-glucosidase [Spirochaetales bacterium]